MEFAKSKKANINYLAKIIDINTFEPHPNADKMKIASVGGYKICVGINEPEGKYIYFPVNCTINPNLLSFCNLYRHTEKNSDSTKSGFFNDNGRVTAIKLRNFPSEGFLLPYEQLEAFIQSSVNKSIKSDTNVEFDILSEGTKEIWICKKYIVQRTQGTPGNSIPKRQKKVKNFNKVIDTQFRFHYDTVQVKKDPWCIHGEDLISLTYKIHGTSGISAYVLCKKPKTLARRLANILVGNHWNDDPVFYDYIYASRSVIKNLAYNKNVTSGFYGCDVWAEADKIVRPHLTKGMTAYYEIVGYLPTGGYIQNGYDYGCVPPNEGEVYTSEKHFKVRIYRVTITNIDGIVHEFSAKEVQEWCKNNELIPVTECYYGLAADLYPEILDLAFMHEKDSWNKAFWDKLSNDSRFYMEKDSPDCINKVPHEGLVIKKEDMRSRAWKLKCFAFLNGEQKELDEGIENIEDNA